MSLYLSVKSCNVFLQFRLLSGCSVLLSAGLLLLLLLQKFHLQSQLLILYTRIFQRRLRPSRFYFDTLHLRNNLQTTAVLISFKKCNSVNTENFSFVLSSQRECVEQIFYCCLQIIGINDLGYFFIFCVFF